MMHHRRVVHDAATMPNEAPMGVMAIGHYAATAQVPMVTTEHSAPMNVPVPVPVQCMMTRRSHAHR